jgi:hypothetical protein
LAQDSKIVALAAEIDSLKQQGSTTSTYDEIGRATIPRADNTWKKVAPPEGEPTKMVVGRTT